MTATQKKTKLDQKWWVMDLDHKVLGRAATRIARILRGKEKPTYAPHRDTGDWVIALNASQIHLTGKKREEKKYYHHSGYPGGMTEITAGELLKTKPEEVLKNAVRGMLPKNILGRRLIKKLKIYPGAEHPHKAQKPAELKI